MCFLKASCTSNTALAPRVCTYICKCFSFDQASQPCGYSIIILCLIMCCTLLWAMLKVLFLLLPPAGNKALRVGVAFQAADHGYSSGRVGCLAIHCLPQCWIILHMDMRSFSGIYSTKSIEALADLFAFRKCIRESVDSLCRDDADMPRPPYIRKANNRPNAAFVSLFR